MWYTINTDGVLTQIKASSLAEVCNEVRGEGNRIKIWSPSGVQLVDTKFGDIYCLAKKSDS